MEQGSILLVGVGGQGVVLASAIVADIALRCGFDVKQSEVHGMSQRGGVVTSHLRFGGQVHSPLIERGQVDVLVAFEWNEALRWLPQLRPGAPMIVNLQRQVPPGACRDRKSWRSGYPAVALDALARQVGDLRVCDALAIAGQAGSPKAANSALLGVLAPLLPFPESVWLDALRSHVPPATVTINERAFAAGRSLPFPEETRRHAGATRFSANGFHGRDESAPPRLEVIAVWCKGCDICVRACPTHVLALNAADKVAVVRPDACTGCRLCELLCPDFAIVVHDAEERAADLTAANHSGSEARG